MLGKKLMIYIFSCTLQNKYFGQKRIATDKRENSLNATMLNLK